MVDLVTLEVAKAHLRVDDDSEDTFVALKITDASDIVIDYLKRPDHDWDDETVPGPVRAAVLLVLGTLWADREGSGDGASERDPISPAVVSLLVRMRAPALA